MSISKSWEDSNQSYITEKFCQQFRQLWENQDESLHRSFQCHKQLRIICWKLITRIPRQPKQIFILSTKKQTDLYRRNLRALTTLMGCLIHHLLYHHIFDMRTVILSIKVELLKHGAKPVIKVFLENGKLVSGKNNRGPWSVPHRLYNAEKPLFVVVVAAPYIPLIQQWCDEISPFGLKAVNLTEANGAKGRAAELNRLKRRLRFGSSDIEIVVYFLIAHFAIVSFKEETQKNFDCKNAAHCRWST